MLKTRPKQPSFIIDAGCGKVPTGLVRKALKSGAPNASPAMKRRRFIGIDETFNLNKLARRTGLRASPENMDLIENCAVQTLAKLKPESVKIIFESFLLNNLTENACITGGTIPCKSTFLALAKRALKPGGRLITIHIKAAKKKYMEIAKSLGMGFHSIEISDEAAKKSGLRSLREKSSKKRRLVQVNIWKKSASLQTENSKKWSSKAS
jgi:ubiquinone/menaquinone biosynthesis C-methylase UbiE